MLFAIMAVIWVKRLSMEYDEGKGLLKGFRKGFRNLVGDSGIEPLTSTVKPVNAWLPAWSDSYGRIKAKKSHSR